MLTRPEKFFTEIGTDAIDRGLADPMLSEFFSAVMSSQAGTQALRLKSFLPYLSLCSDRVTDDGPPPIFYVGSQSSQRDLFGEGWAAPATVSKALTTPDPELEHAAADGYRSALNGKPYYGYARTPVSIDGNLVEVAFERLIVAIRPSAQSDYRFCAYFGVIQDLQKKT